LPALLLLLLLQRRDALMLCGIFSLRLAPQPSVLIKHAAGARLDSSPSSHSSPLLPSLSVQLLLPASLAFSGVLPARLVLQVCWSAPELPSPTMLTSAHGVVCCALTDDCETGGVLQSRGQHTHW
jgi:hypothetical protein